MARAEKKSWRHDLRGLLQVLKIGKPVGPREVMKTAT